MDDLAYCVDALEKVSRTFSRPIALLPEGELRTAVTTSYLLCRIADTVEDHDGLARADRLALFDALLAVLERSADTGPFVTTMTALPGDSDELALCRALPRVMRVFSALTPRTRSAVVPWIAEMIRGMAIYACREPGDDGLVAVETLADLERYCWFVAGTVGRLLTALFEQHLEGALDVRARATLTRHAEDFALGLQLTNILKDVTDDRSRRVSYVPRALCREAGLALSDLVDAAHRERAHLVLAPLFLRARTALDNAFVYTLAIPPEAPGIRLFCLLPVFMAVRTLALADDNDGVFDPTVKVKISRDEVQRIIEECTSHAADDAWLGARFTTLGA